MRMHSEKKALLKDAHVVFQGRLEGIVVHHESLCSFLSNEVRGHGKNRIVRRTYSSWFALCV